MAIEPIHQEALGERVAGQLRLSIVAAALAPGTHLSEEPLSQQFGVSRGPIRDALRMLEREGLVEIQRRKVFVVGLADHDIEELYALREAFETLALRQSVARAAPRDWGTLDGPLQRMREAADAGDASRFAVADLAFHSGFYQLAGNRRLVGVWRQFEPTFSALLTVTTAYDEDLHPSAESHADLLALARAGAADTAAASLSAHLLGARIRMQAAHARAHREKGVPAERPN